MWGWVIASAYVRADGGRESRRQGRLARRAAAHRANVGQPAATAPAAMRTSAGRTSSHTGAARGCGSGRYGHRRRGSAVAFPRAAVSAATSGRHPLSAPHCSAGAGSRAAHRHGMLRPQHACASPLHFPTSASPAPRSHGGAATVSYATAATAAACKCCPAYLPLHPQPAVALRRPCRVHAPHPSASAGCPASPPRCRLPWRLRAQTRAGHGHPPTPRPAAAE
jgi:hypothetical protein